MGRREGSDGMSKRQLVCKSRRGLMAVRCRRHPRSFKSLFAGGRRPLRAIRHNCRRLNIEVVVFNCRRSSSEIVSERETASERKNPNGNGVPAKSAFAAWTRGGIRVRAIGGAGAVGGRSTGGHRYDRPARCSNRDARDATAISTTHHSPSATAHTPHRSTRACARRSTSTAIGDPSAFERQIARSDGFRSAYPFGGPRNARDRR
jgi:hypothetical protein